MKAFWLLSVRLWSPSRGGQDTGHDEQVGRIGAQPRISGYSGESGPFYLHVFTWRAGGHCSNTPSGLAWCQFVSPRRSLRLCGKYVL